MSFDSYEPSKRALVQDALRCTRGLERVVRPRGLGKPLRDAEAATAWAKEQPWYSRLVRVACDARHWVWFLKPEAP